MKLPHIPLVRFYGTMLDSHGEPLKATMKLVPPVPAIEIDGVLIGTQTYVWELDESGRFNQMVLPTNLGREENGDKPWMYSISAGGKVAQIALPYRAEGINFSSLVEKRA